MRLKFFRNFIYLPAPLLKHRRCVSLISCKMFQMCIAETAVWRVLGACAVRVRCEHIISCKTEIGFSLSLSLSLKTEKKTHSADNNKYEQKLCTKYVNYTKSQTKYYYSVWFNIGILYIYFTFVTYIISTIYACECVYVLCVCFLPALLWNKGEAMRIIARFVYFIYGRAVRVFFFCLC